MPSWRRCWPTATRPCWSPTGDTCRGSPHWPLPHDTAGVPGDHYSMIHHDADTTAEAIRTWIGDA
jgi:rifamycin polyketide synthase module 1/2/3